MERLFKTTTSVCLAALLAVMPTKAQDLPNIGTAAAGTLTIAEELQYGDAYMRMLRNNLPLVNDPVLKEYISALGHQLVANANDVKTPFQFNLVRDRQVNAFAFFGGYVVANTGLFLHANSESELASVFSHEIAHVTQRHLARRMEDEARRTPLTVAALVGSILLAVASPEAGIAAINATAAGSIQAGINYTRSNEEEADRFGIATLARAGFDPQGMPLFFGHLAEQYRYSSTPPPMLLTHPLPQSRITDSRNRAQTYPAVSLPVALNFHLAKSRVVARYANISSDAALDWFERRLKNATPQVKPALEYGQALVYLDNDKIEQAATILQRLLKADSNNNFYLDAMSDLYIHQKQYQTALTMLQNALTTKPNNSVLTINYANVLLEANQLDESIRVLQRYTHANPDDPNGWQLLSNANSKAGHEAEQLAARAELFALRADWNNAIKDYTRASQIVDLGSLQQARYDARIDQLRLARERFTALQ